jgi:multiple sugar transport system substrate-binding protein
MLAGPQTSKGFVAIGSANPARRSIAETKAFLSTPAHANLFYGSLAYARPVQAPIKYPDVDTIVMRHLGEVMSGSKTPQDAMQAANSELAAAFKS